MGLLSNHKIVKKFRAVFFKLARRKAQEQGAKVAMIKRIFAAPHCKAGSCLFIG